MYYVVSGEAIECLGVVGNGEVDVKAGGGGFFLDGCDDVV